MGDLVNLWNVTTISVHSTTASYLPGCLAPAAGLGFLVPLALLAQMN
jgi:hypothetical protein